MRKIKYKKILSTISLATVIAGSIAVIPFINTKNNNNQISTPTNYKEPISLSNPVVFSKDNISFESGGKPEKNNDGTIAVIWEVDYITFNAQVGEQNYYAKFELWTMHYAFNKLDESENIFFRKVGNFIPDESNLPDFYTFDFSFNADWNIHDNNRPAFTDDVFAISSHALNNMEGLVSVTLPKNAGIDNGAFSGCKNLSVIDASKNLLSVTDDNIFGDLPNNAKIIINEDIEKNTKSNISHVYTDQKYYYGKGLGENFYYLTVKDPNNTEICFNYSYGDFVFPSNSEFQDQFINGEKTINLTNSFVASVDFSTLTKEVELNDHNLKGFNNLSELTSIKSTGSATSISGNLFSNAPKLKSITFDQALESIDKDAFINVNVDTINFLGYIPQVKGENHFFNGVTKVSQANVPFSLFDQYNSNSFINKTFGNILPFHLDYSQIKFNGFEKEYLWSSLKTTISINDFTFPEQEFKSKDEQISLYMENEQKYIFDHLNLELVFSSEGNKTSHVVYGDSEISIIFDAIGSFKYDILATKNDDDRINFDMSAINFSGDINITYDKEPQIQWSSNDFSENPFEYSRGSKINNTFKFNFSLVNKKYLNPNYNIQLKALSNNSDININEYLKFDLESKDNGQYCVNSEITNDLKAVNLDFNLYVEYVDVDGNSFEQKSPNIKINIVDQKPDVTFDVPTNVINYDYSSLDTLFLTNLYQTKVNNYEFLDPTTRDNYSYSLSFVDNESEYIKIDQSTGVVSIDHDIVGGCSYQFNIVLTYQNMIFTTETFTLNATYSDAILVWQGNHPEVITYELSSDNQKQFSYEASISNSIVTDPTLKIVYSLNKEINGISINQEGLLTITNSAQVGFVKIIVNAQCGETIISQNVSITVSYQNPKLIFTTSPTDIQFSTSNDSKNVQYKAEITNIDYVDPSKAYSIIYSVSKLPLGASLDQSTGTLTLTNDIAVNEGNKPYTFDITAKLNGNEYLNTKTDTISLIVLYDRTPKLSWDAIDDVSLIAGQDGEINLPEPKINSKQKNINPTAKFTYGLDLENDLLKQHISVDQSSGKISIKKFTGIEINELGTSKLKINLHCSLEDTTISNSFNLTLKYESPKILISDVDLNQEFNYDSTITDWSPCTANATITNQLNCDPNISGLEYGISNFKSVNNPSMQLDNNWINVDSHTGKITINNDIPDGSYSYQIKVKCVYSDGRIDDNHNYYTHKISLNVSSQEANIVLNKDDIETNLFFSEILEDKEIDYNKATISNQQYTRNTQLVYSLSQQAPNGITISNDGKLIISKETANGQYQFDLIVSCGKSVRTETINIQIKDEKDYSISFNSDKKLVYSFNSGTINTINDIAKYFIVTDLSNNTHVENPEGITYSLSKKYNGISINEITGEITIGQGIPSGQFTFVVIANYNGFIGQSTLITINISK